MKNNRAWSAAVAVLAALLAVWIDLSPLHRYHNGDSLIPILVSLDRWTPFFWQQNRFGMLLPLLALPLRSPWHNLLFQVWLRILALILSFFLLARIAVPRPYWPAVGGTALALVFAARSVPHLTYLHEQPYFQAMALALGGVLLIDGEGWARRIGGSILIALSFWISPGTLFWLGPLLLVRPEPRRLPFLLTIVGASFAASLAASALYAHIAYAGTDLGAAAPRSWPLGWRRLAEEVIRYLSPGWMVAILVLLAVAAVLRGRGTRAGLCLLAAALGELLVLGTTAWLHRQLFDVRYLLSGLTALAVAGPAVFFCLVLDKAPASWQRAANALVLAALLPLALFRFGVPSPARARAALDEGVGRHAAAVVAGGATHVLGNFWRVWPAVFHADLIHHERGDGQKVWGITFRSAPTESQWMLTDWSHARFAILGPAAEVEGERMRAGIPRLYPKTWIGVVPIATTSPPSPPGISPPPKPTAPPLSPAASQEIPLGLDFQPVRPCRLLDTLWSEPLVSGAPPLRIEVSGAWNACGIPRDARAVVVNVQAVLPPSGGWITAFPADRPQPQTASLAFPGDNAIYSRFQVLPLSAEPRGALSLAATVDDGGDVRVWLDVTGYFRSRPQSR